MGILSEIYDKTRLSKNTTDHNMADDILENTSSDISTNKEKVMTNTNETKK